MPAKKKIKKTSDAIKTAVKHFLPFLMPQLGFVSVSANVCVVCCRELQQARWYPGHANYVKFDFL